MGSRVTVPPQIVYCAACILLPPSTTYELHEHAQKGCLYFFLLMFIISLIVNLYYLLVLLSGIS